MMDQCSPPSHPYNPCTSGYLPNTGLLLEARPAENMAVSRFQWCRRFQVIWIYLLRLCRFPHKCLNTFNSLFVHVLRTFQIMNPLWLVCLQGIEYWRHQFVVELGLKLVSFLQLVGILVFTVVHLLPLDVRVHPLLLNISSRTVGVVWEGTIVRSRKLHLDRLRSASALL